MHLEKGNTLLQEYLNLTIHKFYRSETTDLSFSSERIITDAVMSLFPNQTSIVSQLINQTFVNLFIPPPAHPPLPSKVSLPLSDTVFFVCPSLGRISSRFGKRTDPVFEGAAQHKGIDIATNAGSIVSAAADGTILFAGNKSRWGNVIIIDHNETGYQTLYAHLKMIIIGKGNVVKAGQTIGYVGNTGKSTGPHLHYEIRYNGEAIDPLPFLIQPDLIAD